MSTVRAHQMQLKHSRAVHNFHPWIFSGAVAARTAFDAGNLPTSDLVWHHSTLAAVIVNGETVGWAADRGSGSLCARVLRWGPHPPDAAWLTATVQRAVVRRQRLHHTDAYRLFYADADGIGGVVADLLGGCLVVEYSGAFALDNAAAIEAALSHAVRNATDPAPINALDGAPSDISARRGVQLVRRYDWVQLRQDGVRTAATAADPSTNSPADPPIDPPAMPEESLSENGVALYVQPGGGQKTGYYCDQRENRALLAPYTTGKRVLDAFCYTGGFGLHALHAGADAVVFADSSAAALTQVLRNVALNGFGQRIETVRTNLFEALRAGTIGTVAVADFDLIILDPPKLSADRGGRDKALRAYKELNRAAIAAARHGALIATFSCSGTVTRADFELAVAWAAKDAQREVRVIGRFGQPEDHPVPLNLPEMEYLKGLLLQVEDRVFG